MKKILLFSSLLATALFACPGNENCQMSDCAATAAGKCSFSSPVLESASIENKDMNQREKFQNYRDKKYSLSLEDTYMFIDKRIEASTNRANSLKNCRDKTVLEEVRSCLRDIEKSFIEKRREAGPSK